MKQESWHKGPTLQVEVTDKGLVIKKPSILKRIKKFIHDLLGWGFPLERSGGDSFQSNYSCQFCELNITKDSTGAWFHLSSKELEND